MVAARVSQMEVDLDSRWGYGSKMCLLVMLGNLGFVCVMDSGDRHSWLPAFPYGHAYIFKRSRSDVGKFTLGPALSRIFGKRLVMASSIHSAIATLSKATSIHVLCPGSEELFPLALFVEGWTSGSLSFCESNLV
jgi:hypothetical protein